MGLFIGGHIGVRVYQPNDEFYVTLNVKGKREKEDTFKIEYKEELIWTKSDTLFFIKATDWINENLDNWEEDHNLKIYVTNNFSILLKKYFEDKSIDISKEEMLWLGSIFMVSTFSWGVWKTLFNLPYYIYKNKYDLIEKYNSNESDLWNHMSFTEDILTPWFNIMGQGDLSSYISMIIAMETIHFKHIMTKDVEYKEYPHVYQYIKNSLSSDDVNEVFKLMHNIYTPMIFQASKLFSNKEESLKHLNLLKHEIQNNRYFEEEEKRVLLTYIEYIKEKI